MRALFLLLLFANLAFFAWAHYAGPGDGGADPAPLTREISPERLKIIGPDDTPAAAAAPQKVPVLLSCYEWGSFTLADAPRAEKALEPLALGTRLAQRRTEESAGFWVFIPPQGSRQAALKKAAELKALGVDDYFIVAEDSTQRWALSLGVFRTEEAAQARLAALREQGVKSALVGARETVVPKVWLQVKGVDSSLEVKLKDIARSIEGSELRNCN
ncbi:MAG TPA: SPOR domain-containing protein [Burkholderiales bacterium]|nr:SPOR domain-containing protein [Burkholderiales bacterium]